MNVIKRVNYSNMPSGDAFNKIDETDGGKALSSNNYDKDLDYLLEILPQSLQKALKDQPLNHLIEIVLDLGRIPEARFMDGHFIELGKCPITEADIHAVVDQVGFFTTDNRGGIARTLHRISAIRNRQGQIIGLTCRVGKVVTGTITPIHDLIEDTLLNGKSLLVMGRPGMGKTTKLREIAKMVADEAKKRVVIVDTSNEIAGDGDIPHPAVGRSRRIQVPDRHKQKDVMIEAVQNHTPELIVIDEIGTEEEAFAARTIAERGVALVGTAHGNTLENLIKNPTLSDLVGGIETVTLGDDEARRRSTQKTVLERGKRPTFDVLVELRDPYTFAVYRDVAEAVDQILRGWTVFPEVRKVDHQTGDVRILQSDVDPSILSVPEEEVQREFETAHRNADKTLFVYIYGLSKTFVDRVLERLELKHVGLTRHITEANAIIALRSSCRPGSKIMRIAEDYEIPVHYAKTNTLPQILRAFREAINSDVADFLKHMKDDSAEDENQMALQEALDAIEKVRQEQQPVELNPQRSYLRRLQHEMVEKHGLYSTSTGDEPQRRIKILPFKPV